MLMDALAHRRDCRHTGSGELLERLLATCLGELQAGGKDVSGWPEFAGRSHFRRNFRILKNNKTSISDCALDRRARRSWERERGSDLDRDQSIRRVRKHKLRVKRLHKNHHRVHSRVQRVEWLSGHSHAPHLTARKVIQIGFDGERLKRGIEGDGARYRPS
jgi:hypothetical protein